LNPKVPGVKVSGVAIALILSLVGTFFLLNNERTYAAAAQATVSGEMPPYVYQQFLYWNGFDPPSEGKFVLYPGCEWWQIRWHYIPSNNESYYLGFNIYIYKPAVDMYFLYCSFSTEGRTEGQYRFIENGRFMMIWNLGNIRYLELWGEKLDDSPPVTSNNYDGAWHNEDFTITLTAEDPAGINATYYRINATGPVLNVSVNGQPRITEESANNTLEYWSIDNAGNEELPHKILTEIKLDRTSPIAKAGADQTINEDTLLEFNGSASSDENSIASYTWAFTDMTPKTLTGTNPTYAFGTPGAYTITLNVTDAAGNWATDTVVITVLDVTKPVANAGQDQTVNVGTTITFDASTSTDNVGIVSYEWNFGDGTISIGKTTTHIYKTPATYTVTLTVKDAVGNTGIGTRTVTVLPEPSPMWIVGIAIAAIGIAITVIIFLRRRK